MSLLVIALFCVACLVILVILGPTVKGSVKRFVSGATIATRQKMKGVNKK